MISWLSNALIPAAMFFIAGVVFSLFFHVHVQIKRRDWWRR